MNNYKYNSSKLLQEARSFAEKAHGDQMYGNDPYIEHLDDVFYILADYNVNEGEYIRKTYQSDDTGSTKIFIHRTTQDIIDYSFVDITDNMNEYKPGGLYTNLVTF